MTEKTFAKKYGLEGKGVPVRISKEIEAYVQEMHERAQRIIKAGEFFAKTCKMRFGGDK